MDAVAPLPRSTALPEQDHSPCNDDEVTGIKTHRRWSNVGIPGRDELQADCYIQERVTFEQPSEGFGIKAGTLELVDVRRRCWINQVVLPLQPPPPEEAPILHEFSRPWRALRLPLPAEGDSDQPAAESLLKNYDSRFTPGEPTFPSALHVPAFLEPRVAVEDSRTFLVKPRVRFALGTIEPLLCRLLVYDIHLACRVTEEFCFRIPGPATDSKGAGPVEGRLPAALVYILPNHLPQHLHMVLKVTKVLVGDGDGATAPYCTPDKFTSSSERRKLIDKAADGAKRLGRYQQSLAWGTLPFAHGANQAMPLYRQRTAVNEEQRLSLILEAARASLKEKPVPAQCEFDVDEVDAKMLSGAKFESEQASTNHTHAPGPPTLALDILDPFSESSSQDAGTPGTGVKETQQELKSVNCREVQPFCHPSAAPTLGLTGSGPVAVSYVNTLYLYPLQIEKSQYRNVAIRVQLLQDTIDIVSGAEDSDAGSAVLRAIYGADHQIGKSAYALVTYHQKNPQFEDEIKICLPECLTPAHHILFTFYHVHCKKLQPNQHQEELIGYAALPLLGKRGTVLQDNKYVMDVFPAPPAAKTSAKGSTIPLPTGYVAAARDGCFDTGKTVFSCRSRVISSVHSQDSAVAEFLHPFYSSNMRVDRAMNVKTIEEDTVNRLLSLAQSDTVTVRYFFIVITKFVLGYLRFGSSLVRWAAFRTLLAIMEKAAWSSQRPLDTHDTSQVIHEFVRIVFDEGAIEDTTNSGTDLPRHARNDRVCSQSVFASLLEEWFNVLHNKSPVEENADTKRMSLVHSSVLLQLTLKSVAMHMLGQNETDGSQEPKTLPKMLELNDEGLLGQVLAQLIECAGDTSNGLLVQKEVNRSVAFFCRGVFLVANNAVPARVITGYMNGINEAEGEANTLVHLWFPFVSTLIDFEFFATVNGVGAREGGPAYTHLSAWLAKAIFEKLLCIADTQKEDKIKSEAMRLLRRMFVAQVYNLRYQTSEQQEMISLLYFPLLPSVAQFTAEGKLLADSSFGDAPPPNKSLGVHITKARRELQKEVLICVGHLLSSVSNAHLPLFFRILATGGEHDASKHSSGKPRWRLSPTAALSYYHRVIRKAEQLEAHTPMEFRIDENSGERSRSWNDAEEDDDVADSSTSLPYNEIRVHACLAIIRLMIDTFLVEESSTRGGIQLWQQLLSPDLVTCDARISLLDIEQRLVRRRSHRRPGAGPDATASFNSRASVGSNTSGDHSMIAHGNGNGDNHKSLPRNWGKHYANAQVRRGSQNIGTDDKSMPRSSLGSAGAPHNPGAGSSDNHDDHVSSLRQTVAYTVLRTVQTAVDQYEDIIRLIEMALTPRLGQPRPEGKTRRTNPTHTVPTNQAYALLGSLTEMLFFLLRRASSIEGLCGNSGHSFSPENEMEGSNIDGSGDHNDEDAEMCFVVELLGYLETLLSRFPAALFAARIPELPSIYDQARVELLISIASSATARGVRQSAARLLGHLAATCYHQTGSFLLVKAPIVKVLTSVFFPLVDRPNPSPSISPASLRDMLDEMKTLASPSTARGSTTPWPPLLVHSFQIQFFDLLNGLTATVHAYERWRSGFTNPDGRDDFEEIEEGLDRVVKAISPHWLLDEKLIWLDALQCLHARRERFAEAACCKLDAIRFVQRARLADDSGNAENTDELHQWVTRQLVAARNYAERAGWVEQELAISEELLVGLKQQRRFAEYHESLQYLQVAASRLAASQEGSHSSGTAFSFYRVRYTGDCVSARIARSEYIYKRSKFTSLGEFVSELKAMLRAKYPHCERVDVVPEPKPLVVSEDQLNTIFLRVTTVEEATSEELCTWKIGAVDAKDWQVAFRFALPFTLDGASSYGKTAEQMKRITYLSVARAFPCCLTRQLVLQRHEELRCPIDNSMDDIRKRCALLRAEVDKEKAGQSDLKTLTLVLKGSVDTHVHGGVPEVLDSFLAAKPARVLDAYGRVMGSDDSVRKRHELANLLVGFAQLCWQCLLLSREAFRRSSQSDTAVPSTSTSASALPALPHATPGDSDVASSTRSFLPPSKPADDSTSSLYAELSTAELRSGPATEVSPLQTEFERSFAALVGQIRSKIPFAYRKAPELAALQRQMQRLGLGLPASPPVSMSGVSVSPLPTYAGP